MIVLVSKVALMCARGPRPRRVRRNTREIQMDDWSPAAAFSPDGKLVATCSRNHVHVWFAMGGMAGSLAGGPFSNEEGRCLAFSADGRRIASGTMEWNSTCVECTAGG
jgi:hypothetical protein